MELCFPSLAQEVDWAREIQFLEQELKRISRRASTGDRCVDKLAKLWLRDGREHRILLHLELQAQQRVAYEEHVFEYNVLARLFYKLPVASVAILADANPQWRPTAYQTELLGCRHTFEFPTAKLLDIARDEAALLANPNPFAIVILAQVRSLQSAKDVPTTYQWKKRLVQMGYDRGYSEVDIVDLFTFIDWVMVLPEALELQFEEELTVFEKERSMEYITSIERRGISKGLNQGLQQGLNQGLQQGLNQGLQQGLNQGLQQGLNQGLQQGLNQGLQQGQAGVILRQLNRRLGQVDSYLETTIRALGTPALESLAEALLDFHSLSDLTLWLETHSK